MPIRSKRVPPTLTFRIEPKLRLQLRKHAEERHMSEGALVALLVEQGLSRGSDLESRVSRLEEWMWQRISDLTRSEQPASQQDAPAHTNGGNQTKAELLDEPAARSTSADR